MKTVDRKASGACPTFFRALCRTAAEGGPNGYASAGYGLARSLSSLAPHDMEDDEWHDRVAALADLICPPDCPIGYTRPASDAPILEWFLRELPRCMELIPPRRRGRFLEGVYAWVIDEENDIASF